MADNVTFPLTGEGDSPRIFATDEVAGVHYQRIKLDVGADGAASLVVGSMPVSGDVAHDVADSGSPQKVGFKALSTLPSAVATGRRANAISDLFGRQLVAQIDPLMQTWKSFNATTTQTGVAVWTPTAGKKIAISHLSVSAYGTTAGRLLLWFGAGADTTYTAGTDQLVVGLNFAPSATIKTNEFLAPATPIFCTTADHVLRITTDANLSVDIAVYGWEY